MAARTGTSRLALWLGGAAAAGGGYYLYRAGGNPRAAEKELEREQRGRDLPGGGNC